MFYELGSYLVDNEGFQVLPWDPFSDYAFYVNCSQLTYACLAYFIIFIAKEKENEKKQLKNEM